MMKKLVLLTSILSLFVCSNAFSQENITDAIVKIYTTFNRYSYFQPWRMEGQKTATGSGCIISDQRILTNAHVVSDNTFIQVRRAGQADKFVATVKAVSHELDLAILDVADKRFFEGVMPLEIGDMPKVGDKVTAFGFPKGGTRITITEGVVSRIDRSPYIHTRYYNLICQIDAAINPGSSGGPIISNGKIAGVAFQATGGQNIGYMVPSAVVRHFFDDLRDGRHDGVPSFPVIWQNMENPQMRKFYRMPDDLSGILVVDVSPAYSGSDKILPNDIILSIDGTDLANDGTIPFRQGERIDAGYAVDRKQIGDSVDISLLREGKKMSVHLPLTKPKASYGYLIPRMQYETPPTYFIYGGMVFSKLTVNYLATWRNWKSAPVHLQSYYFDFMTKENEDIKDVVVLIDVLADEINVGYSIHKNRIVKKVNGKEIKSMKDLVEAFETHQGPFHTVTLSPYGGEIVLSREAIEKRNDVILKNYHIPKDRSQDLVPKRK